MSDMHSKKLLICVFIIALILPAAGTAAAATLTASPNPAAMNKTVTFKIGVTFGSGLCDVEIDFGDGSPFSIISNVNQPNSTVQVNHTYSRTGVFTVRATLVDCAGTVQPNPVFLTLRVSDFEIKRLETLFDTGKPQVTVQRNQPAPGLSTIINYSGSGFIKGYWEVDGDRQHYFFKQLSVGPREVIEYPKIPGLSTFKPGSHVVRFVITEPALDIAFPKVVYYVTEQSYLKDVAIEILTPGPGTVLPYKPITLSWQKVANTEVYMVHIFSEQEDQPIFSAYSKKSSYYLRPEILERYMKPEHQYYFQVQGFHEDTRLTGQSNRMPLAFGK
jgi:hypothetical protein